MAEQFKELFKNQAYRSIFNWRGIEKATQIEKGRIMAVVYGEEIFTAEEENKLYNFFATLAKDSIDIPNFTA